MIRRAALWVALGFILTLLAWPSPAADGATDWVCSPGSVQTCIRQSTDHSYSTDAVTVTAQFRDDGEVIDAGELTIFVNGTEARTVLNAGQVSLTYKPDPGLNFPVTDEIYAAAFEYESAYRSPTIDHSWVDPPVLKVTAAPTGTSGEVGSAFVVHASITLDTKPLRDTAVNLASAMPGQPAISRTATSDANGSVTFTYTRQAAGQDQLTVSASWQGQSASARLTRQWRLAPPPTSPPPTLTPTLTPTPTPTPTLTPTRTPSTSTPTPSDSPGSPWSPSPSTPSGSPTPLQASLELSPNGTTTTVGREFTVTATLSTRSGDPVPDRQVTFETTKHGEAAILRTATTDGDGNAQFTYRRNTTGSDSVRAWVTVGGTGLSERILHRWIAREASPEGTLRLDSDVVNPGSDLRLTGSGCPPNGPIELSLGDVRIAGTRADSSGAYRVVAPLPELPLGRHKITANCAQLSTTATVDVVGVTAAMGTAGAAGVTTVAVLAFFVLLGGSIVRGLGNLGIDLPFR